AAPLCLSAVATLCILAGYVLTVIAGAAGIWLAAPRDWRLHVLLLLPVLVILAGHTLAFGHSRYHLPLIPILGLYGAALVSARMPLLTSIRLTPRTTLVGATATVTALVAIWIRPVLLTDLARISALLQHVG